MGSSNLNLFCRHPRGGPLCAVRRMVGQRGRALKFSQGSSAKTWTNYKQGRAVVAMLLWFDGRVDPSGRPLEGLCQFLSGILWLRWTAVQRLELPAECPAHETSDCFFMPQGGMEGWKSGCARFPSICAGKDCSVQLNSLSTMLKPTKSELVRPSNECMARAQWLWTSPHLPFLL